MRGKPWRFWCGLAGCAIAVEDEVFEEEESAEVEGGLARPCHPVCDRGRRMTESVPLARWSLFCLRKQSGEGTGRGLVKAYSAVAGLRKARLQRAGSLL